MLVVPLFAFGLVFAVWLFLRREYRRLYGCVPKWWAVPFTHGALLFGRRLPETWERCPE